jgi:hypothetical protein
MRMKSRRALLGVMAAGIWSLSPVPGGATPPAAKSPPRGAPDADLLEFLGSLDSAEGGAWHDYLENTDLDRLAERRKPAPPPASGAPARGKAPPSGQPGAGKS